MSDPAGKVAQWSVEKLAGKVPYLGLAVSIVKLGKSIVDANIMEQLEEVRKLEACPHVKSCTDYGFAGMRRNAQNVANDGKTAWEAPNRLWVYHDQPDFKPLHAIQVFRPLGTGKWGAQGRSWGKPITGTSCHDCDSVRAQRR
jgi:hypothetical protein